MKRPIAVYFVAVWCFIVLTIQVNSIEKRIRPLFGAAEYDQRFATMFAGVLFLLVIWHTVRFIQLKSFNRWFSAASLVLCTVFVYYNSFGLVHRSPNRSRAIITLLSISTVNILCFYYLSRASFRDFAVRFVVEREQVKNAEEMQKISQKAVMKDLKDK